ncbi:MAG: hypothetical protein ABI488_11300 [Polyangiaceae bacterium]
MITSKHASVIVLAGLLGVVTTQPGCSSDTSGPTGTATAGSSGAPTGAAGAGVSGGGSSGMASTAAGAPAAGAAAAGAAAAGAAAAGGGGSGGTGAGTAGSGGSTAGSGGSTAGAGGGSAVTFAQVKTIFSSSCGTGQCHNKASGQLDFQGTTDLHGLLTTAIPGTGVAHCNGTTLVTPNNSAGSFLVTAIKGPGKVTCKKSGADEMIGRMPDNCSTSGGMPACLSAAQIKTISDWIDAGAPG